MPKPSLTKIVVGLVAIAGTASTLIAGPEQLPESSKDKMIQPMAPACDPRWYISAGLGIDIDTQATSFVNYTNFSPYGDTTYQYYHEIFREHSWDEVYDNSIYRVQLELGYVLTPHIEVFARGTYEGGYGRRFNDRDIYDAFDYGLRAYTGLYRSWGGELGARYFFFAKDPDIRPFHQIRPYVSLSGGASYVDHIGDIVYDAGYATGYYSGGNGYGYYQPFIKGKLYDGTVVGTGAAMIGAEMPLGCRWSLGIETGIRYQSELDGSNDITRYNYFGTIEHVNNRHYNDAGDKLSVPIMGYVKYRFGGNSETSLASLSSSEPISLGYDSKDSKDKMVQPLAPECDPRWYVSAGLGIDFDTQLTSFVNYTNFSQYGDTTDQYYHEIFREHSWGEIYDNTIYRVQLELGYVLNDHIELFLTGAYEGGYGGRFNDRDIYDAYDYGLRAYTGLYRSWGGELGGRYFFFGKDTNIEPFRTIRPYVSLSGGASYVDHIGDVVTSVGYTTGYYKGGGGGGTSYGYYSPFIKGNLYNGTVVGTGAAMFGFELPIACHWSLGIESGLRYQSGLDGSNDITRYDYYDTVYHVNNRHYNDAGERLSVPVNGYLKFRF